MDILFSKTLKTRKVLHGQKYTKIREANDCVYVLWPRNGVIIMGGQDLTLQRIKRGKIDVTSFERWKYPGNLFKTL